jgi:hypothetical protein
MSQIEISLCAAQLASFRLAIVVTLLIGSEGLSEFIGYTRSFGQKLLYVSRQKGFP